METSIFLAKVIGISFFIFGISLLVAKSTYQAVVKDILNHPGLGLLVGAFNLVIGILIIVSHNIWQMDWRVLITVIGWLMLIRGIIWTILPKFVLAMASKMSDFSMPVYISGIISLILGIILCYYGFWV